MTKQRKKLENLIARFADIFARDPKNPGTINQVKHFIHTENHLPINQPSYRVSKKEEEVINKEVEKMLKNKVIKPSKSPWSSPIVLVKKKDGNL